MLIISKARDNEEAEKRTVEVLPLFAHSLTRVPPDELNASRISRFPSSFTQLHVPLHSCRIATIADDAMSSSASTSAYCQLLTYDFNELPMMDRHADKGKLDSSLFSSSAPAIIDNSHVVDESRR